MDQKFCMKRECTECGEDCLGDEMYGMCEDCLADFQGMALEDQLSVLLDKRTRNRERTKNDQKAE